MNTLAKKLALIPLVVRQAHKEGNLCLLLRVALLSAYEAARNRARALAAGLKAAINHVKQKANP
jgi:hypothetical protein